MKRYYFLGLAAGIKRPFRHLFVRGSEKDLQVLSDYLGEKYGGEAMPCKNGRSALALALMAYFNKGDAIIINGFTCYAVYEAVKAAGLTPIFADISKDDLNFNVDTLEKLWTDPAPVSPKGAASDAQTWSSVHENPISGIIIQNTLGNMVDIKALERFAGKHGLVIIEDLAHSAGMHYADGREAGTVGAAAVLSFGKEKAIDTTSGGAVVFRHPRRHEIKAPSKSPKTSDYLRARWYPVFGLWCRKLTRAGLGGALMSVFLRLHFVEKSADSRLRLTERPAKFEAKLALEQLKSLKENKIRDFYLVRDRDIVLRELRAAGYYFDGFWYEKPVSPARYYKKVHFDEKVCPVAVEVAEEIVNLPNYYSKKDLSAARKIIEKYLKEGE